ncbi:MAG: fibronectin type III domain-containing protein [Candidatus Rokubacteria bacterium]|nr:fibronectin type III domain-containing protein [Candidatus Rokubacteria bacterium]
MRRLLVVALIGVAAAGCGRKGPPVAPERRVPAVVSGLTATVEGNAIVLSWMNPTTRADGTRMKDLTRLRVHRRAEAPQAEPKPAVLARGAVVGYDEIASIRLAAPAPAKVEGHRITWIDRTGLAVGRRYAYAVTAVDGIGRSSPPSARLAVTFLAAPRRPERLTASAGEGEVSLSWAPPAALVDGSPLSGALAYEVLRAASPEALLTPVTPAPITATGFTDTGLQNDLTYYYAVRAVRREAEGVAQSEPSAPVAATPADLTPPSAPANLVAVPSEGAIRLAWSPSPEPDVAGYIVYRASPPGEPYVRVTPGLVQSTVFTDRTVEGGRTYAYVVTAVDRARRANESARSDAVTATLP